MRRFAFLRVYESLDNQSQLFGVDITDDNFMCVSYMMADIYKVYELWQDPNFVNNYSFDSNNYLQCEGLVELQVDEKTYQEHMAILNKEFKVEEAPTLMKLLKTLICVDAKFVIQKESKAETGAVAVDVGIWEHGIEESGFDSYGGEDDSEPVREVYDIVIPCYGVKFSKSTMSVYFNYYDDDGLHHWNIMRYDDIWYVFNPFSFLVSSANLSAFQRCMGEFQNYLLEEGSYEYRNESYVKYKVLQDIPLLANDEYIFTEILHKAIICSERYNNVLKITKDFMSSLCDNSNVELKGWAGKDRSFKTNYGIYFKTQYIAIPTEERVEVLNRVIGNKGRIKECPSLGEVQLLLKTLFQDFEEQFVAFVIATIIYNAKDHCDMMRLTQNALVHYERQKAFADLYSYRMRGCFLLNNESVTAQYQVAGSDESGYVIIKEVLRGR